MPKKAKSTFKVPLVKSMLLAGLLVLCGFTFANYYEGSSRARSQSLTRLAYFSNDKVLPCKPIITAHRGKEGVLENSVPGIRYGIKTGADAVEIDVRETKDGVLVLMHDGSVDRTTNGSGRLRQMTFEQVKSLRIKDNIRVPTLSTALKVISGYRKRTVQLDLKGLAINQANIDKILELVDKYNMRERVIVASTDPLALDRFHQAATDIPTGYIQPDGVWPNLKKIPSSITTINVHWKEATTAHIRAARNHGIGVLARSIRGEKVAKEVIRKHVLVVMTDTPADVVKACRAVAR